ncbi:hypothetical protein OAM01_02885 [bacterium]|nr:hypothetical protein [bacterium]
MKRGSRRILVGFLMIVVAVVLLIASFSSLYTGKALDNQFPASGSIQVSTHGSDRFYVWNHYVTLFEGKRLRHSSKFPGDVHITVKDSSDQELEFISDTSQSWSIGNHAKQSVGYIDSTGPTELTLHITGGDGGRVLSFGKADMKGELKRKLGGFAVALIVGVFGLIGGVWGLIVRISNK